MFFVIKIINFHFVLFYLKITSAKVRVLSVSYIVIGAETGRAFWSCYFHFMGKNHANFKDDSYKILYYGFNPTDLKAIIIAINFQNISTKWHPINIS